ncbi:MAG: hypothetical protein MK102_17115 [Fuerstiella sp.]|nr:hypothetical protein [Fuerstiella sp.]
MNKAFVREPELDSRPCCPRCGSLGASVNKITLDHHVQTHLRRKIDDTAWFCAYASCDVAYFDLFERSVAVGELQAPVYPKDIDAPICACFGFTIEDIDSDVQSGTPTRIRELLAKSETSDARCHISAADGQCCTREVQRLYMKQIAKSDD